MRRSLLVLLAAFTVAGCDGDGESEGVRLRFSYREGDTLHYLFRSEGVVTLPDTSDPSADRERSFEKRMRIEAVTERVTPRDHFLLKMTYRPLPEEPDASGKRRGPITFRIEMTPRGQIVDVRGVEATRPFLGEMDFQSYFEQSQPVFPERPLRVGDSWTQEVKVVDPESEPVVTSSSYVLERLSEEAGEAVAVIAFEGDIYLPVRVAGADTVVGDSVRTLALEERIRVRGTIHLDHRRGVVLRVDRDADAVLTKVKLREGRSVRREIRIREQSRMRLVEEEPPRS